MVVENKILGMMPNSMLVAKLKQVQTSLDLHFPIFQKQTQDALNLVRDGSNTGARVIISRGMTASFLRNALDIPVVEIEYDFFQFAHALRNAFEVSDCVAIVGFIEAYRLAERAVEFVRQPGQTVHVSILPDAIFVEQELLRLARQGVSTFIGGNTVVLNARKLGFQGVYIEPDTKSIEAAIIKAQYELRIHMDSEEKFRMIESIINHAANGIFAVDGSGRISVANPQACKYLKVADGQAAARSIKELLPQSGLLDAIMNGQPAVEEFISIGGSELVMDSAPIMVDSEIRGAVVTVQEADQIQDLGHKIRKKLLHRGHTAQKTFADIIGGSAAMQSCIQTAQSYARVDSTILILGKTGTGKEVFAQSIHNASRRALKPFVAVNCAALPSSLLESELFGYTKGAFTGARTEGKTGIFELAHTGTIFLDEISEIPMDVQARLLRVVQEKEITRIGDDKVIPVDVRILAATNRDLAREVRENRFREDLYYRLTVLELRLPELALRREDIPDLVRHFVKASCAAAAVPVVTISREAIDILMGLPMPGNVRQLGNIVEKTLVISGFKVFDCHGVYQAIGQPDAACVEAAPDTSHQTASTIADMETAMILRALTECHGSRAAAAKRLGLSPTTLWRRLRQIAWRSPGIDP